MVKAGGEEVWGWVPREEDDGADRDCWICHACPAGCTGPSFKKASIFSYESEEKVREYLVLHLTKSGHHLMEDAAARELAATTDLEVKVETFQEREQLRQDMAPTEKKAAKRKQASAEGWDESWGESKKQCRWNEAKCGGGDDWSETPYHEASSSNANSTANNAAEQMVEVSKSMVEVVRSLATSVQPRATSDLPQPRPPTFPPPTPLTLAIGNEFDYESLVDNLERIFQCIGQATSVLISAARTLTDEGSRIRAAQQALQQTLRRH